MTLIKTFSEALAKERKNANLTQSETASMLKVHENTVRSWEKALTSPDLPQLERLLYTFPNIASTMFCCFCLETPRSEGEK